MRNMLRRTVPHIVSSRTWVSLATAAVVVAAAAFGCSGSTDPFGVAAAVVYGTVTRATGAPAQGVMVGGIAFRQGCSGSTTAGPGDVLLTDANGAYRVAIGDILYGPGPRCVQMIVFPRAGVTDTVKVIGPTLKFRNTLSREPLDSARVDIRLP